MASIDNIKKLRELTGAGISDCRNALDEASDNVEKAVEVIKKRGLEKATKKSERTTGQGLAFSYVHGGKIGVLVTLLCETDFVAKTEDFQKLGKEICLQVASMNPANVEELLAQPSIRDGSLTINDMIKGVIGKLGENIKIGEINRLQV